MAPITKSDRQFIQEAEIWHSLISAIAASSGFQRWLLEQQEIQQLRLEQQVQMYLRETLETLAY